MMRTPIVILGALLLVGAPAAAQQTAGVVLNPVSSPILPDIVAIERVESDRQELRFLRLSSQQEFSSTRAQRAAQRGYVVTLPDISAGTRLSAYAGQLDWRPVADQGRSWFAYVASNERGSVGLLLNYIDGNGQLARSDPIAIPFAGQARAPRWSPDGKHLAFVSDSSVLYIVSDVSSVLRSGSAAGLVPTRITTASRPALFPAWSPFGDHIAYGIETVSRGNRNGAIEVLPLNKATGRVIGPPVIVTGELVGDNEYRPSWSPDGQYVAFYADQSGMGGSRQQVSIGVAEVILNSRDGKVFRGVVKEGRQRWLADNVIPDEVRGPAWSSISDGSQKKDALLYVRRDPTRSSAIMAAAFQRWVEKLPREQYESELSAGWSAPNPKSVSSTEMLLQMRFVFTSVKGGGDVVSYHDAVATWAKGPTPLPTIVANNTSTNNKAEEGGGVVVIYAHKGQDVAMALIPIPGLGQFSAGESKKGSAILGVGLTGLGYGLFQFTKLSGPRSRATTIVDAVKRDQTTAAAQKAEYDAARATFDGTKTQMLIGGGVYALSYLAGIFDAAIGSAPGTPGISLKFEPERSSRGAVGARMGFRIPIGGSAH